MMADGYCETASELAALRAVFDSLAEHVAVVDRQGVIVDVNAAWRRFVAANGGDPDAVVGTNYLEVCEAARGHSAMEAGRVAQGIREVLAGHLPGFQVEYPCHSPTEKRWFLLHARPWIHDGRIVGAVVSHIPITHRKLAELTLQRYERAVASSPNLISVVSRDYTYVLVNDTYLRYHARRREDIEGHRIAEVMGDAAFVQYVKPHLDRCFAGETIQYEAWFQMAGMGRRCMAVTYYPCHEPDGTISGAVVAVQDVTERRLLEDEVRRTATLLAEAQALAHVGSFEHDFVENRDSWSDELFRIVGYEPGSVHSNFELLMEHVHPEDRTRFLGAFTEALATGTPLRQDVRLRTAAGDERWGAVACTFEKDADGVVTRVFGAVADITERRLAELRLEALAATDALTGLMNRRRFFQRLEAEVARAARFSRPLSVAMVDVDHFKRVNDTYGHATGDAVLRAVAQTLREALRAMDAVGRVGGEEFAVLLPETGLEAAAGVLERIRQAVAGLEVMAADGRQVRVTVSAGVAAWQAGEEAEAALRRADAALYAAKSAGRNRVVCGEAASTAGHGGGSLEPDGIALAGPR